MTHIASLNNKFGLGGILPHNVRLSGIGYSHGVG